MSHIATFFSNASIFINKNIIIVCKQLLKDYKYNLFFFAKKFECTNISRATLQQLHAHNSIFELQHHFSASLQSRQAASGRKAFSEHHSDRSLVNHSTLAQCQSSCCTRWYTRRSCFHLSSIWGNINYWCCS